MLGNDPNETEELTINCFIPGSVTNQTTVRTCGTA